MIREFPGGSLKVEASPLPASGFNSPQTTYWFWILIPHSKVDVFKTTDTTGTYNCPISHCQLMSIQLAHISDQEMESKYSLEASMFWTGRNYGFLEKLPGETIEKLQWVWPSKMIPPQAEGSKPLHTHWCRHCWCSAKHLQLVAAAWEACCYFRFAMTTFPNGAVESEVSALNICLEHVTVWIQTDINKRHRGTQHHQTLQQTGHPNWASFPPLLVSGILLRKVSTWLRWKG